MNWNQNDLERLFKCSAFMSDGPSVIAIFDYATPRLRYQFWVHIEGEQVSVSADSDTPFGADSLYEIYVPCRAITVVPDPYYQGQKGIACWYGEPGDEKNRTLTILWRPDGDLKVWPQSTFPPCHPSRKTP